MVTIFLKAHRLVRILAKSVKAGPVNGVALVLAETSIPELELAENILMLDAESLTVALEATQAHSL
ncbi:MAG: hypothetical protein PHV02_21590 [Rhodocyclaceae bacterium]|nr:hypothetical protein [Rhodocyclaceae bacterium]